MVMEVPKANVEEEPRNQNPGDLGYGCSSCDYELGDDDVWVWTCCICGNFESGPQAFYFQASCIECSHICENSGRRQPKGKAVRKPPDVRENQMDSPDYQAKEVKTSLNTTVLSVSLSGFIKRSELTSGKAWLLKNPFVLSFY